MKANCPTCGIFTLALTNNNELHLPEGNYCGNCGWHSARKRKIDEVLPQTLVDLIRLAPENVVVRTLVQAHTGLPLPEGVKDLDKIKEWLEFHPTMQVSINGSVRHLRVEDRPAITVNAACRDRVQGTCTYYQQRRGMGHYQISRREMNAMAEEADGEAKSMKDLVQMVIQRVKDMAGNAMPEMREETCDYDDYNESDEGYEILDRAVDARVVKRMVADYLYSTNMALYLRLINRE